MIADVGTDLGMRPSASPKVVGDKGRAFADEEDIPFVSRGLVL